VKENFWNLEGKTSPYGLDNDKEAFV
jgi:hypothetical protein